MTITKESRTDVDTSGTDFAVRLGEAYRDAIKPMGQPDEEQLALINRLRPLGRKPYTTDEVITVPVISSNNLLNWGNSRWDREALYKKAETYPGKPFAVDHPQWTVKNTVGFVYDSQIIESNAAPPEVMRGAGEQENNEAVVKSEGFIQMVNYVAIATGHPILDSIGFSRVNNVSTACIVDGTYICPLDGTRFGEKSNMRCAEGHYMPHPWIAAWLDEEEREMLAPYYIKSGVIASYELSCVLQGNLPAASIPKAG